MIKLNKIAILAKQMTNIPNHDNSVVICPLEIFQTPKIGWSIPFALTVMFGHIVNNADTIKLQTSNIQEAINKILKNTLKIWTKFGSSHFSLFIKKSLYILKLI